MKKIPRAIPVLILYLLITLFFLRGVLLSPGAIAGGDWGFPLTSSQMWRYFKGGFYTWSDRELLGAEHFFLNLFPSQIFTAFLVKIGISGEIHTKLLLVLFFIFPAFTMYLLCRFLNCREKIAFLGGLLYFTLPFFFNYAAIGWLFVLFSMGILPLALIFFIKSVKEEKIFYSVLTGILYFLATIQSQSLIWYPLAFLSLAFFLINNKKSFLIYLKSLLIIFFVFLGISAFWWLPFFLSEGSKALSTRLGLSSVSLGTWVRLSNLNILRAWGSLYNYQYENSYPRILMPLSFLLPFLAYLSLLILKKKRIVYSLVLLSFVPIILFRLGPNFITRIPFSDFIRDIARFLVLSSFSYVILTTLVLGFMLGHKQERLRVMGVIFSILLLISTYPFWAGELFGNQRQNYDVRLRTYRFPPGYLALEDSLKEEKTDMKILYLPIGSGLNILDDKNFYGSYRGIRDIFASYSLKPGIIGISDKEIGSATGLNFELMEKVDNRQLDSLVNLLSLTNVKYMAVRENVDYSGVPGEEITTLLSKESGVTLQKKWDKISLFETDSFLPHFYTPQNIIYSQGNIETLADIVSFNNLPVRSGIYINNDEKWSEENEDLLERSNEIFVVGELVKKTEEKESRREEGFVFRTENILFPYVRWRPDSLVYPLVLKKEQLDEWRTKNDSEKIFDKKLFYATKRISEIEKWGEINLDRTFELYRCKMEEAIELLKETDWGNERAQQENVLIFQTILDRHWFRLKNLEFNQEEVGKIKKIFDELRQEIEGLRIDTDVSELFYYFEIPQDGNYQLLVKNEEFSRYLDDDQLEFEFLGEKIAVPIEDEKWISSGSFNLEKGEQKLRLARPEIINLLGHGDWQTNLDNSIFVRDGLITSAQLQPVFPGNSTIYFKPIEGYQGDAHYKIAFDYFVFGGKAGMLLTEDAGIRIRELRMQEELSATGTDSPRHFEKTFQSRAGAKAAEFYFWAKVKENTEPKIEIFNVKIERVFEPTIFFHTAQSQKPTQTPKITFIKINPTKYKIKVEGAKEAYDLVFSESFHQGWKAYIDDQRLASSDQFEGIVASYFDGEIKEGMHKEEFLNRNIFETWRRKPIPEERHFLVNGYANSWYIIPEDAGGKENYEIIIEFWPQRLFYLGIAISLVTLLSFLGYLTFDFAHKRLRK